MSTKLYNLVKQAVEEDLKHQDIDYFQHGRVVGEADFKDMGFGSDILSSSAALLEPYILDPNDDDYGKKLLDFARGYIEGSKMPSTGKNTYGDAEAELRLLEKHIQKAKKQKELGYPLEAGKYYHP